MIRVIPLFSGIGNVIQSIPFANEIRNRYGNVSAYVKGIDYPDTIQLVKKLFDNIYAGKGGIPPGSRIYRHAERRSFPEYKAWFTDNREPLPKKYSMKGIRYEQIISDFDVVIAPETKKNWPCKTWPYYDELFKMFDNAVVIKEGRLKLMQVGGLIKNAKIFIGNEGGLAHYAAALGVKTYIIMGCSDPVKNLPPNNAIPISLNLDCQPCQFRGLKQEGNIMLGCDHRDCLTKLTAEYVYSTYFNSL